MTIDISAEKASLDNAIAAFADDVNEHGLVLSPDEIIADGRIHRCPVAGKGRRNLSGRYLLHLDGIPAGGFQNWTDGNGWQNWSFREGPQLSAEEREELGRKSTAAREAAAAQAERDAKRARDKAGRILIGSEPLTEHAYLTKKRVAAYGLRLAYNDIIVPLRDVNGQLQNLQYITADGDKFFLRDGRVSGFFHPIGDGPDPDVLVIAEGYATGATIHAVTGHIALVAFNAGNLEPVATAAHKRWPHADIIIAADDDHAKDRDKGTNAGITCGMAAALAVNGKVAVPDFAGAPRGEKDTDFNDLANHPDIVGEDAVKRAFDSALKPDDLLVKIILADPLRVFSGWRRKAYAELKGRNQEAFERLRGELKKAGVRITELDGEADAPASDAGNGKDQEKETERQVDKLVSIARSKAQFFHTPKRVPYADISRNGARETHPIRGHDFRMWLGYEYHQQTKASPSKDALANAVGTLEGYAQYEGEQRDVFIRVGGYGGKIYIDLGDVTWRAIEVDADGWRIVNEPPVRFRRSDGAQALPEPTRGESIRDLRPFLNVSSEAAFVIIVAWIVGALRDRGPYLVVAVYGPGGSAKTTMARLLRSLTDPRIPTTERLPRDRETLILNASLAHVQAFDNISVIQLDMSDDLSTLATGSGLTKRALYTDEGQTIFEACRPLLLNGIETFVLRGDLASRTATVTLEEIADDKRRDEETFLAEFEAKRPGILGALLDAVSRGLRQMPTTKVERLPRMADAAKWVVACETGATWAKDKAGRPITFLSAPAEDNEETALAVLATSPLARELRRFIEILKAGEWRGTVGALYAKLNDQLDGGPDGDSNKERKALAVC